MQEKPLLLGIVGPTASGKTELSMAICKAFNCEVIAMDSMQIYKHMNIGTAKPTIEEQEIAPHHMINIISPGESFSAAAYTKGANEAISKIYGRGKLPLLVGGTGLYLQGMISPMEMGGTNKDEGLRKALEALAETPEGKEALFDILKKIDDASAQRLHINDTKRVIRAIEVYRLTGRPFSEQKGWQGESPYRTILIGLNMPRELLYDRIDKRVDLMMKEGLLDEVKGLLDIGVPPEAQAMQGLGYKELVPVITQSKETGIDKDLLKSAVAKIKQGTRNYAKRQITWFKRYENILWLNPLESNYIEAACAYISKQKEQP